MKPSTVYFTKDISPVGLQKVFQALQTPLLGKTAVKISTGEPGGHNFLSPTLIADLVKSVQGTLVECNTAYAGKRNTNAAHWQTFQDHGFMAIAPCDLMDEEGELSIPVFGGVHLEENFIGSHMENYSSMVMLSHFKGHAMGGFGGALKNMSIGIASAHGKLWIHGSGDASLTAERMMEADHNSFLESMADACKSVMDYFGRKNIVYINIANRLSVDCDCDSNPHDPEMADIGIFASTDPVALDQACVDAVYASEDLGKAALMERMESRNGILIVETAAKLGLGCREYRLQSID